MNVTASSISAGLYTKLAKPVLFRIAPDQVHSYLLMAGAEFQKASLVRRLIHGTWAFENPASLAQVICDIDFVNPVGLSAGFDKNFELVPLMKAVGFGHMEGGSVTYRRCAGNPRPWFHRLPQTKSLVVYAGLANQGIESVIKRIKSYPADEIEGFPLNISVAKTNSPEACSETDAIADYVGSLQSIKAARVGKLITLNISCPNTYGGEPFTTPDKLDRLLTEVDGVGLQQPVFVKMPCHLPWDEFDGLVAVAARHQVAGLTISNLAKDRGQAKLMDPLPESVAGNLSGRPTWDLSNDLIKRTYRKYGQRFTIIGVGGIFSAQDAYTKIRLGASLVELITGLIFEGPQLIGRINRELDQLLLHDGFTNVSQAVGADVS
jgi:dihydroorotate dehydrogenase (fumarate)